MSAFSFECLLSFRPYIAKFVIDNASNPDRYEMHSNEGGGYYFILNAANGAEIGRSVTFRSEEARNETLDLMRAEAANVDDAKALAKTIADSTVAEKVIDPYKPSGNEDNYKPLKFYEARITGIDNGFD